MNLTSILGILVVWFASVGYAFVYGQQVGQDGETAQQARIDQAIKQTKDAAQEGAANAIAQIKIVNTTVRAKTETLVRENIVYRDCVHPAGQLRNINEALSGHGQAFRPGVGKLPGTVTVD